MCIYDYFIEMGSFFISWQGWKEADFIDNRRISITSLTVIMNFKFLWYIKKKVAYCFKRHLYFTKQEPFLLNLNLKGKKQIEFKIQ